jgi:N-carbamoyl-L-amino-acid hydrolase
MLSVNGARLRADLADLARIGRLPGGGISRTSFSAADTEARAWYRDRCAAAGLAVEVDGIGNMFVSRPDEPAAVRDVPAVWSGSHLDTVPNGGWLDGALGSIAALECLRRLHEEQVALARPVRAVVYADEEGNYTHLFGSSALARGFTRTELEALTGRDGDRFVDTFAAAGGDLDRATRTAIAPAALHASVELHIEQGPYLEREGRQLGVVTSIVGLGGGTVTFRGRADHAGTTPMDMRKDALTAASALVVRFGDLASSVSDRAVLTAGIIAVAPGASNVVPAVARLTVDFRDVEQARVERLATAITGAAQGVASRYGVGVDVEFEPPIPPSQLDSRIQRIVADAAAARGLTSLSMPSGAGHDSQNMATLAPTGMIFVPSIGGRSHCPEEDTAPEDIDNGANVLLDTIVALAA